MKLFYHPIYRWYINKRMSTLTLNVSSANGNCSPTWTSNGNTIISGSNGVTFQVVSYAPPTGCPNQTVITFDGTSSFVNFDADINLEPSNSKSASGMSPPIDNPFGFIITNNSNSAINTKFQFTNISTGVTQTFQSTVPLNESTCVDLLFLINPNESGNVSLGYCGTDISSSNVSTYANLFPSTYQCLKSPSMQSSLMNYCNFS